MKKHLILPMVLICAACVPVANDAQETHEQIKQNAEIFAKELEASKDPVRVMDAYITYFQNDISCDEYGGQIYCRGTQNPTACSWRNNASSKDCPIANALTEPDTMWWCIDGYQSDECILYRRKMRSTEVAYFDYKRFLGNNTRIKNDTLFLRFANAYAKNLGCETEKETTSFEKQGCKERRDNFFRQAVKQKIHCRDFVESEYRKWLKDALYTYNSCKQDWKYSHEEAMEQVKEKADSFSKMYLCDIRGWQKEIFK